MARQQTTKKHPTGKRKSTSKKRLPSLAAKTSAFAARRRALIFSILIALIGAIWLLSSRAATITTQLEAETSVLSGPVSIGTDTSASGGKFIEFKPAPQSSSPSGEAMPVGDLSGWKQIFTEDFATDVPLGGFPGSSYVNKWDVYGEGWKDTAANVHGGPGRYYTSKVVSVKNGVLNKNLHTETINGVPTPVTATLLPRLFGPSVHAYDGQLYGRYAIRFRSDSMPKYKVAWLLWPDSGVWPRDGEVDWPEGNLNGTMSVFMHRQNGTSGGDQDVFHSHKTFTDWHTAVTEWTPNKMVFYLDGQVIGTSTKRVPNTPMHWILQTETCLAANCVPDPSTKGNVQIDWVAAWSRK